MRGGLLSQATVDFLSQMQRRNEAAYTALCNELNYLCTPVTDDPGPGLYIRAHHFDAVVRVLKLQMALPFACHKYFANIFRK